MKNLLFLVIFLVSLFISLFIFGCGDNGIINLKENSINRVNSTSTSTPHLNVSVCYLNDNDSLVTTQFSCTLGGGIEYDILQGAKFSFTNSTISFGPIIANRIQSINSVVSY